MKNITKTALAAVLLLSAQTIFAASITVSNHVNENLAVNLNAAHYTNAPVNSVIPKCSATQITNITDLAGQEDAYTANGSVLYDLLNNQNTKIGQIGLSWVATHESLTWKPYYDDIVLPFVQYRMVSLYNVGE